MLLRRPLTSAAAAARRGRLPSLQRGVLSAAAFGFGRRGVASAGGGAAARPGTTAAQRLAGLSGALAVAAGAAGAHALPRRLRSLGLSADEQKTFAEIFGTASRYHLLHATVLLCAPFARFPRATAGLLVGGKVLFVGSLYAIAYEGDRHITVAKAAPVGGGLLILGWLSFAL
jgi:uncharacterized membrane protein YgdD (TMEM256/DUF423 family)